MRFNVLAETFDDVELVNKDIRIEDHIDFGSILERGCRPASCVYYVNANAPAFQHLCSLLRRFLVGLDRVKQCFSKLERVVSAIALHVGVYVPTYPYQEAVKQKILC